MQILAVYKEFLSLILSITRIKTLTINYQYINNIINVKDLPISLVNILWVTFLHNK